MNKLPILLAMALLLTLSATFLMKRSTDSQDLEQLQYVSSRFMRNNSNHSNQSYSLTIPYYSRNHSNSSNTTNSSMYGNFSLTQSIGSDSKYSPNNTCPGAVIFGIDTVRTYTNQTNSSTIVFNCTKPCPKRYATINAYMNGNTHMYNSCQKCIEDQCLECSEGRLNPYQETIICRKAEDGYYIASGIVSQQSSYSRVEKCPSQCVRCGDVYNGRPFQNCTVQPQDRLYGCAQEIAFKQYNQTHIQCSVCESGYIFVHGQFNDSPGGYCIEGNGTHPNSTNGTNGTLYRNLIEQLQFL